jgi:hypothetical protein
MIAAPDQFRPFRLHPDLLAILKRDDPEAVMLQLVRRMLPFRRSR